MRPEAQRRMRSAGWIASHRVRPGIKGFQKWRMRRADLIDAQDEINITFGTPVQPR